VPISFPAFQWLLAAVMLGFLIASVLPVVRFVKRTTLPPATALLAVVPVVNTAWLFLAASSLKKREAVKEER
jgi:hypothetical protein